MQWFNFPLALLALLLLALWLLVRRRRRQADADNLYRLAESFLDEDELSFHGALEQAVGERHRVLCKVRMASLVDLRERLDHRDWQRAFEAIRDRHFDFLVCCADSLEPVCAIVLDERTRRPRRDPLVDTVCHQAGLPLLRFPRQRDYVAAEIGLQFDQLLATEADTPELSVAFALGTADGESDGTASLGPARGAEPNCPECGAPMARRETRGDFEVEQAFWLCGLPECRHRVPLQRDDRKTGDPLDGLIP